MWGAYRYPDPINEKIGEEFWRVLVLDEKVDRR
jgi:hypothetical protein